MRAAGFVIFLLFKRPAGIAFPGIDYLWRAGQKLHAGSGRMVKPQLVDMAIDPKSLTAIQLVRQHTQGPLAGPIKPRWLSLALPKIGKNRAWIDHTIEGVLCWVLSAYRLSGKRTKPFWNGPAYQVNRRELAVMLDCRARDISTAVRFLEDLDLIWVWRKARYVDGEPKGTLVMAIPNVEAIADMLRETEAVADCLLHKSDVHEKAENLNEAEEPNSGTQGVEVQHSAPQKSGTRASKDEHKSLNAPKQHNAAAGRTAERVVHTSSPTSHSLRSVAEGGSGGAAAADKYKSRLQPAESADDTGSRDGQRADGPTSEAPNDCYYPSAKEQAESFVWLWIEAGRRTGAVELVNVLKSDRELLEKFFRENNVDCCWMVAMAIKAWFAADKVERSGGFDTVWGCRRSKDIQTFLRFRSKILNELGANGIKVNAYKNLRRWFTDSELRQQGFEILAPLELIQASRCWEDASEASAYYEGFELEMPPEVRAALAEREAVGGEEENPEHET